MDLQLPTRLQPGDRVAALTLSWGGPAQYPEQYEQGVAQFTEAFGIEVVEYPCTRRDDAWLRDHPEARVADLHAALADPDIDGIVSTIGGDDSIRLLPMLDLDLVAANPKVAIGFSDSTTWLWAFLRAGVLSFYGPSLMAGFGEAGGLHALTRRGVQRMLLQDGPPGEWPANEEGWTDAIHDWGDAELRATPRRLRPAEGWRWHGRGTVEGPCIPACLEIADWLRGSAWWPDLDGAVLVLEASEEAPGAEYLLRFLRTLALRGDLDRIAALLYGRPAGEDPADHQAHDDAILRALAEVGREDLPVVTDLDVGHTFPQWTLPVGGAIRVDPEARSITFPSPVTSPPAG